MVAFRMVSKVAPSSSIRIPPPFPGVLLLEMVLLIRWWVPPVRDRPVPLFFVIVDPRITVSEFSLPIPPLMNEAKLPEMFDV